MIYPPVYENLTFFVSRAGAFFFGILYLQHKTTVLVRHEVRIAA